VNYLYEENYKPLKKKLKITECRKISHAHGLAEPNICQTLAAHPPSWLKKCFKENCKFMMARATNTGTIKRMSNTVFWGQAQGSLKESYKN
jgi:hypothetical protein